MPSLKSTERHARALTAIRNALTLADQPEVWLGLSMVLQARLSAYERACLLTSVTHACDSDLLFDVMEAIVPIRLAGAPLPVFLSIEEDACWWADLGSPAERKAWITACFLRLSDKDKAGFLAAAQRRAAA